MVVCCIRMSPNVTGILLLWTLLPGPQAGREPACPAAAVAVLEAAEAAVLSGEFDVAFELLQGRATPGSACAELAVATRAWAGWLAAASAALLGGSAHALGGVRAQWEALGSTGPGATDSAYATALLRAAAVAAQDERDELQLWVEHARDLAARRALVKERARWPLSIDLAEGELWSGVDDYELAEASYTRALAERDSALGWRGLARARDRRGNRTGACAAYRRALDLASAAFPAGVVATEARGYLLACQR